MKNVKTKKRKILNELIQEIVNEQVEMMLLEYGDSGGGALYAVFIQPFVDTGNVIKAEIGKVGSKAVGITAEGLLGAFSVLLPMLNKIPFTEKTWQQGIEAIKNKTKESIGKIDQKYANSYNAVNASFTNPDLAFLAFSFNPGLYLGSVLGAQSVGTALSLGQSMLGTSGNLTNSYYNFLNTLGIFSPRLKPQSGGVNIDVGMGGYGDSAGGLEENHNLKNYVSILVEKEIYDLFQSKKILKEQAQPAQQAQQAQPAQPAQPANVSNQKDPVETLLKEVVDALKNHNITLNENNINSIREQIGSISVEKYRNEQLSKLENAKLENIVNVNEFINQINDSAKGNEIRNEGTDNLIAQLNELSGEGTKPYPENIDGFIKKYDTGEINKEEANKILSNFGIKITKTLEDAYNKLSSEQKEELKTGYEKMVADQNKKKKQIPDIMKKGLGAQLGGTIAGIPIVDPKTIENIVQRVGEGVGGPGAG